ncbi:MAG: hypothetical protein OXU73_01645 [Candidatus Campbellbacteria bacterium]|nr:hypothetical protein [Candidatus Campbellbacteria bacterium]
MAKSDKASLEKQDILNSVIGRLEERLGGEEKDIELDLESIGEEKIEKTLESEKIKIENPWKNKQIGKSLPIVNNNVTNQNSKHYTQDIDGETAKQLEKIFDLLNNEKISAKFIKELNKQSPFVIDAFHDVVADFLYDDFVKKGIIKEKNK